MKKTIQTPHDRFFRAALSDQRVAREFFESHLPSAITDMIDLKSITMRNETYVDENLEWSHTDVLFDTTFQGRPGYLYVLIEHQSTSDPLMPFRLLKYLLAIMDYHLKMNQTTELPLIYPLIFYTGKAPYRHSTDIFDLFGSANQSLAREIFLQPFELVQVNQIPDEHLKQRVWLGILELSMKHIFKRDILLYIKNMLPLFKQAEDLNGSGYVQTALTYLAKTGEVKDPKEFLEVIQAGLSPDKRGNMATIAQYLEAKGREEGMQQGMEKGIEKGEIRATKAIARKLLRDGLSLEAVSRATDLSIEELNALIRAV